jgi:predicted dehydrogenase
MIDIRVNAGYIPPEHWIHDPAVGGGRLLGEGCHFFDLLHFFADSSAVSVNTSAASDSGKYRNDNFVSVVRFANGSVGTVTYVANGDRQAGKERIEVFCGGVTGRIDDFHDLRIFAGKRKINRTARLRSDKGHRAEWSAFIRQINGKGPVAHEFAEACAAMRTTFAAQQSMLRGKTVLLRESGDSRTSGAASS